MEYFFLHCVKLEVFPIFGQHTYRSICFIKEMKIIEIPNTKKNTYRIYSNEYILFYSMFEFDKRETDKALFTFGQYLKAVKKIAYPPLQPGIVVATMQVKRMVIISLRQRKI